VYGMQYLGAPEVWGAQLLGDNITIASPNAAVYAGNTAYWMGTDKFYTYDGTVKTLPCSVRSYIFNDFNLRSTPKLLPVLTSGSMRFGGSIVPQGLHRMTATWCTTTYKIYGITATLSRSAWMDSDPQRKPT
jgi:hypothetical protein